MRLILAALAALCLLALPAYAADLTATPATFAAQLKAYACGDTITLAPGKYGEGVTGAGLRFSTKDCPADAPLTIKGQPGAAFVTGILMDKAQAVAFDSVEIGHVAGSGHVFRAYAARDLAIRNSTIHGAVSATGSRASTGVKVDGGSGVSVVGNRITDVRYGVVVGSTDMVQIADNDISRVAIDGINIGGVVGANITGNHVWDFYVPTGAHADCLQMQQPGTTRASERILIDGNLCENALEGPHSQGIFGGPENGVPFQDVRVSNNLTLDIHYRAVSITGANGLVMTGNRTLYQQQPDATLKPWIVATNSTGVTIGGNASMRFITDGSTLLPTAAGNMTLDFASAGEIDAARADWLAKHRDVEPAPDPRDTEIADLTAKAASLVTALAQAQADAKTAADALGGELSQARTDLAAATKARDDAQAVAESLRQALEVANGKIDAARSALN